MMKSNLLLTAAVLAAAWAASCGTKEKPVAAAANVQPLSVATAAAVTREVPADFEETGTFLADESSDIAPLVAGRVISTPVDVGAHVVQGQVVCELDHRDAQLKLDQARAQLAEAT